MRRLFGKAWIGNAIRAAKAISGLNISLYAANAGFFIVLSLFPMLVLLMGLLRRTGLEVWVLLESLDRVIPRTLMDEAEGLLRSIYRNANGAVVGLSAVTALWSASRGVHGLRIGLNAIYGVEESRGYLISRGISLIYTLALLVMLLLTLTLHVFGNRILQWRRLMDIPGMNFLAGVIDLRFFLLLTVQTLMFTLMYVAVPNRSNRFRDNVPGALLASIGWLVFSDVFSIYVEHFSGYADIYGSVYAVALGMLWLYWCLSIVFYGGALNRWLIQRKKG